jgi:hypothetical protein
MLWFKLSFDWFSALEPNNPLSPQVFLNLVLNQQPGLAAFRFSLYLGFSTFSIFPLLYGFQTPPIRIATISRILKILCSMHLYHLQYYLLRVTSWGSIPLPYNSVSDPALRARTRRADERISDADNSIAPRALCPCVERYHSRIAVGCLVQRMDARWRFRPASPARRRRT